MNPISTYLADLHHMKGLDFGLWRDEDLGSSPC